MNLGFYTWSFCLLVLTNMRNLPIARLAIEKGCRKAHGHEGANRLHVNFFAKFGRSLKNEYYRTYLVNQRVFKGLCKDKLPKEYGQNKGGT